MSYVPLFTKTSQFLNVKLETTIHNTKEYLLIRASNRKSLSIILSYLNKFKLYSSKYLDFKNWAITGELLLNNTAYITKNKNKIYELKNSMNNKRIIYNWEHLQNL